MDTSNPASLPTSTQFYLGDSFRGGLDIFGHRGGDPIYIPDRPRTALRLSMMRLGNNTYH